MNNVSLAKALRMWSDRCCGLIKPRKERCVRCQDLHAAAEYLASPATDTGKPSWDDAAGEKVDEWPAGVSDGLTLPCQQCGKFPRFDYTVTDSAWNKLVPAKWKLGVVCLPCLDFMAAEQGADISGAIEQVQFTGLGFTAVLRPTMVHRYEPISAPPLIPRSAHE